jgi:hypothetical protein
LDEQKKWCSRNSNFYKTSFYLAKAADFITPSFD